MELAIQVQIGIGQSGLGALHNNTVHILDQKSLQNLTFQSDPVLGGQQLHGAVVLGQHILDGA